MSDMAIGHEQVITTDYRLTVAFVSTAIQGHKLADNISIPKFQPGSLSLVFLILWRFSNRGKLEDTVIVANFARAHNHDVGADHRSRCDLDVRPYYAISSDLNIGRYLCADIDDSGVMYH
jgi:hypothetical protein